MIKAILGLKKKLGAAHEHGEEHHYRHHDSGAHAGGSHGDDESNWLVSYADMMTLLCGFFIMLFSMSKLDEPQFERVKQSVAEHFGGEFKSPAQDLSKWVTQIIQDTPLKGEASVEVSEGGVAIIFKSQVFFETLSAEITESGRRVLGELAAALREREQFEKRAFRFVVEGHTDSRPVLSGSFPTNWELSSARASRVVRVFLDSGFDPRTMAALGYADTRPLKEARQPDGSWDDAALAENRRVVIRVFHEHDPEQQGRQQPAKLALQGEEVASRSPAEEQPKGLTSELEAARHSAERIREALKSE